MELITSATNQLIKRINKLKLKKYRESTREFFVEGYKNVLDTATAKPELVKTVVFSRTGYESFGEEFAAFDFDTAVVADELFARIVETESAQGILSINTMPDAVFPSRRCVLLEKVRDPGNVGTILRTACACGYDAVLNNCADVFSPKVARSAMSAIVKCNIGIDIALDELISAGYELIVADMSGQSVFEAARPEGKYCIIIGNEAEGVSDFAKEKCARILSLPQQDMESLNAAVAAGVMMYTLRYKNN